MRLLNKFIAIALSAFALTSFTASATAQEKTYPVKPVHVVFPFPPGSPLDAIGRLISERASEQLGQSVIFENKPGANGILGTNYVARAKPDGYVIHLTSTTAFLLNSFLRSDLPYQPLEDFVPITAIADLPVALMTRGDLPVSTTEELIAYLKKNPDTLNYASVGNGSFNHLLMEQIKASADVDILHVPYQGVGPLVVDLMGGRIDATILSVGSLLGQWKAGQMKVLSFMTTERHPQHPDVPAITETLPDFQPFGNWLGFVAPAGTPQPVINRLSEVFRSVLEQPEVIQKIEEQHWRVISSTPEEFSAAIRSDLDILKTAFELAEIKPE